MNTVSRTLTGTVAIIIGITLIGIGIFLEPFVLLYGIPIFIVGLVILFNTDEDVIEQIKTTPTQAKTKQKQKGVHVT